jgi:hypothetical protein
MTPLEAVSKLREYDHAFLTEQGVDYFAKAFGVKLTPYLAYAEPDDPKGLRLERGATSAVGMDAAHMAEVICRELGVAYVPKMGRGFRLQTCCSALEKHFKQEAQNAAEVRRAWEDE